MKPFHLVCFSALLLRNSPPLLHCTTFAFHTQAEQSCSAPTWPWLKAFRQARCERRQDPVQCSHCRTRFTMSHPEADYGKHNVCRLVDVQGLRDPMDVIVAGQRAEAREHVIFFGGDVQDYPENMLSHRDNGQYIRWNSLATAGKLCERFPTAMVLVIKPHHMHLKTFSVYSQFMQANDFGCPLHTPDFGAWQALVNVYKESVSLALGHGGETSSSCAQQKSGGAQDKGDTSAKSSDGSCVERTSHQTTSETPKVPVHLIGFSKGCVVLNQLVHELESVQTNSAVQNFIGHLQAMTWLDGGHSGGSNTWVTDQAALGHLAALNTEIHVHVTPYQVKDPMRKWIGKEERRFVELLRKAGAKVTDKLHFEDESKSIDNHFRVLEVF